MYRVRSTVSSAVAVAALAMSGCAPHEPAAPAELPPISVAQPASAPAAAVPPVEALADVLYRLADPAVRGAEKLGLIEAAKPDAADTLDRFAAALKDNGYAPLTFDVTNIAWSDRHPGNATADVNVTTGNPGAGPFSFPMEFKPHDGGWQLSRQTADLLLAFGSADKSPAPTG